MTVAATIDRARAVLALDRTGRPLCPDRGEIYTTIQALRAAGQPGRRLVDGFLSGAEERYAAHVAPLLRRLDGCRFEMGSGVEERRHFCGEVPRHPVVLPAFAIGTVPVTNGLFALLDPARSALGPDLPVVDVTWFDAAVFALWVGCRLPTEAEWEYACGAGAAGQWCNADPGRLADHAWYSENAGGRAHPVAARAPNELGLFDLHGNVWEWCEDDYAADYYARAPLTDPVNVDGPTRRDTHKVSRGGGFLALAEMCRTRYRLHDPAEFWAGDLGFRLARGGSLPC